MRGVAVLTAVALGLAAAPEASADPVELRRFALVAGADDGGPQRVKLQYAATDAEAVADVFTDLGGIDAQDVIVLSNPDRSQMMGGLDDLHSRVAAAGDARTEVVVYYSGHSDERGLLLGTDRLLYDDLKTSLKAMPSDVKIAILDSCSSGALIRKKGGVHRPPFMVDESGGVTGHAFITSSSADEASQESDRVGGSFFTHYLVSGLRGGADVDEDGRVTLNEAYRFAFDETLARTEGTFGGAQHANYDIQLMGSGDLVMTDLKDTSAGLRLPGELEGRFFVRDRRNRLQAEVNKPFGKSILLGLSPGLYQISLEQPVQYAHAMIELDEGELLTMSPLQFVSFAPEGTTLRGGELPVRSRFRDNPNLHRSFVATSAVTMLTAFALYGYSMRAARDFQNATSTEELEAARRLNNQLVMTSGAFGGIGIMSGVGAAVTIPVKDTSDRPSDDWVPPLAIQGAEEAPEAQ